MFQPIAISAAYNSVLSILLVSNRILKILQSLIVSKHAKDHGESLLYLNKVFKINKNSIKKVINFVYKSMRCLPFLGILDLFSLDVSSFTWNVHQKLEGCKTNNFRWPKRVSWNRFITPSDWGWRRVVLLFLIPRILNSSLNIYDSKFSNVNDSVHLLK